MRLEVSEAQAGERLDALLAGALGSRARAQRLIDAGAVTVDGAARPKRHLVRAGEVVEVGDEPARAPAAPAADVPFAVAYEDDHLLVVDKPAGAGVHPPPGQPPGPLAQGLPSAAVVHRPDPHTRGQPLRPQHGA